MFSSQIHIKETWPRRIKNFLISAVTELRRDDLIRGVLLHGSYAGEDWDVYSDLDMTCVTGAEELSVVMAKRSAIAESLGSLEVSRSVPLPSGEQALFCLYGTELLRVEIVFKALNALSGYGERPLVLWERSVGEISAEIDPATYVWPKLRSSDIEGRFWLCVEQAARRLCRGEIMEVINILAILRHNFLGPMLLRRARLPPNGLRKLELSSPQLAAELKPIIGSLQVRSCRDALLSAIDLYERLRTDDPPEKALDSVALTLRQTIRELEPAVIERTLDVN